MYGTLHADRPAGRSTSGLDLAAACIVAGVLATYGVNHRRRRERAA
jgi:hypothetical protein